MGPDFDCSIEEMKKVTDGYFGVHLVALPDGDKTVRVSGLVSLLMLDHYHI